MVNAADLEEHVKEVDGQGYWQILDHLVKDHGKGSSEVVDKNIGRIADYHRDLHFPKAEPVPCPTCGTYVPEERIASEPSES